MKNFYLTKSIYEASLQNPKHQKIRAELLEIDKEIAAKVDMSTVLPSQRPPAGYLPSRHWSRIFELPWCAEAICHRLDSVDGAKVLDVGSGISPLPTYLARHGMQVTCLDVHPVKLPGVKTIAMDAREWKGEERFDVITCISTVEHIPGVNLVELFKQWAYGPDISKRPERLFVSMDVPLRSPYGVDIFSFADLLVWLSQRCNVPRFPGYINMLNSADFGEEGSKVGRGIGVFCLEL